MYCSLSGQPACACKACHPRGLKVVKFAMVTQTCSGPGWLPPSTATEMSRRSRRQNSSLSLLTSSSLDNHPLNSSIQIDSCPSLGEKQRPSLGERNVQAAHKASIQAPLLFLLFDGLLLPFLSISVGLHTCSIWIAGMQAQQAHFAQRKELHARQHCDSYSNSNSYCYTETSSLG